MLDIDQFVIVDLTNNGGIDFTEQFKKYVHNFRHNTSIRFINDSTKFTSKVAFLDIPNLLDWISKNQYTFFEIIYDKLLANDVKFIVMIGMTPTIYDPSTFDPIRRIYYRYELN